MSSFPFFFIGLYLRGTVFDDRVFDLDFIFIGARPTMSHCQVSFIFLTGFRGQLTLVAISVAISATNWPEKQRTETATSG